MNIPDLVSFMSPSSSTTTVLESVVSSEDDTTTTETETETTDTTVVADTTTDVSDEFDTFLRLLTAQISNQDPLAPLDSTQFVEQLATFSQLELQATTNNKLDEITRLLAEQVYASSDE